MRKSARHTRIATSILMLAILPAMTGEFALRSDAHSTVAVSSTAPNPIDGGQSDTGWD